MGSILYGHISCFVEKQNEQKRNPQLNVVTGWAKLVPASYGNQLNLSDKKGQSSHTGNTIQPQYRNSAMNCYAWAADQEHFITKARLWWLIVKEIVESLNKMLNWTREEKNRRKHMEVTGLGKFLGEVVIGEKILRYFILRLLCLQQFIDIVP